MYNASELFIVKDVLEIYTQHKQNNECMFITTCLHDNMKSYTIKVVPCAKVHQMPVAQHYLMMEDGGDST